MDHSIELIVALSAAMIGIAALARRLGVPYPLLLVLGGAAIAAIPGLPRLEVAPDVVLLVFLPPLLFGAAQSMSTRELREQAVPIGVLALVLVLVTMAAVAVVARAAIPGMPWTVAFTLGAIVSPPDPVAATAIARRLGLPHRLVVVLEGEGLFNDATALVAYRLALAAVVTGSFSLAAIAGRFVLATVGAVVLGLLLGWLGRAVLRRIDDAAIETTVTLLIPYAGFLVAERVQASGIIAVLVAGLYLRRYGGGAITSAGRVQGRGLWATVVFVLEGASFLLIGLGLRPVVEDLHRPLATLLLQGAVVSAAAIVVRIAWVLPGSLLLGALRRRAEADRTPHAGDWREGAVVAWAGMRGVISMVTALALPRALDDGSPFPQRDLLVFTTFVVIFVTLVGQGLTLPALIRRLGVTEPGDREQTQEAEARASLTLAALRRLDELTGELELSDHHVQSLRARYEARLERYEDRQAPGPDRPGTHERRVEVARELLRVERDELQRLHHGSGLPAPIVERIERELDIEEARLEHPRP